MSALLRVIQQPRAIRQFGSDDWNRLLQEVRDQQLGARLGWLLEDQGLLDACPDAVRDEFLARRFLPRFTHSRIRLELRKLRRALTNTEAPVLLLKGAAYMALELPLARGRTFADLDVLVPRDRIEVVEAALLAHGWETQALNAYDQRYYRRWMHEVPPLRHKERGIEIDLHHAILPLTSRLQPEPVLLWQESRIIEGSEFRVLSPPDMLLHSAVHCFHDGAIAGALPQLLDVHEMLIDFGAADDFWRTLLARAERLQLGRPLYYALTTCRALFATSVPSDVQRALRDFAPNPLSDRLMRHLLNRVLEPSWPARRDAHIAAWLLFVRSHWLRMPPGLLGAHLGRKLWRRAVTDRQVKI